MDIKQAGKNWAELGETDPMWAILSADDKRGGKWNQQEFFATGREEIGQSLKDIQDASVTVHRGAALDFGGEPRLVAVARVFAGQEDGAADVCV